MANLIRVSIQSSRISNRIRIDLELEFERIQVLIIYSNRIEFVESSIRFDSCGALHTVRVPRKASADARRACLLTIPILCAPVGILGLGLPLMLGCSSARMKNLYVYSVDTLAFLEDYFLVTSGSGFLPYISFDSIPETFYFGVSGNITWSQSSDAY